MSGYPDFKTYKALYQRYFEGRDVGELIELLAPLEGMRLLDLCCGEGQLTLCAIAAGARGALAVDVAGAMMSPALRATRTVRFLVLDVDHALEYLQLRSEAFDRIACRQAVNYWLDEETAGRLAALLTPGGTFVFNTFNQKPPEKPRVLEYEAKGHSFVEVSWLVGDDVHHLQARDGMAPHHTMFKWIPPERVRLLLEPYFTVEELRQEKTSLYKCVKKQ